MGDSPFSSCFTRRQNGNIFEMPFPENKISIVQVIKDKCVKKVWSLVIIDLM